jgi:hypothetical protein
MRAFHATSIKNVDSIERDGLVIKWDYVYLTDSIDSALRWIGFRLQATGEDTIAVIEVEVEESKLEEGMDHSPMMVQLFGVGKSWTSSEPIPATSIKEVHLYSINNKKEKHAKSN